MANKSRNADGYRGKARNKVANKDRNRVRAGNKGGKGDDSNAERVREPGFGDAGLYSHCYNIGRYRNVLEIHGDGQPVVCKGFGGGVIIQWHSSRRGGGLQAIGASDIGFGDDLTLEFTERDAGASISGT